MLAIPRPGYLRVITADRRPPADQDAPVTLAVLQDAVDDALGRHVGLRAARWLTRFGNAARQAAEYVRGRVMLAGDAAHIHPPAGAIGVNVALDDAFNLGWKLAAAVRGSGPSDLLDSYHTERHPAGAHVLASTQAQVLLDTEADRLRPLVDLLTRVAAHPAGNRAFAETVTGLDTRYDMGQQADHPWLGRLTPNLELITDAGHTDLATQLTLAAGRPLLLDLANPPRRQPDADRPTPTPPRQAEAAAIRQAAAPWADRVGHRPRRLPRPPGPPRHPRPPRRPHRLAHHRRPHPDRTAPRRRSPTAPRPTASAKPSPAGTAPAPRRGA